MDEAGTSRKGSGARWPIRWYMAGLLATTLLPIVVALALALAYLVNFEILRQKDAVLRTAERVADLVDREMDGLVAALQALATSPSIAEGNLERIDRQARQLATQRGAAIALRQLDGQQLINTLVPFGSPLPKTMDPVLREADLRAIKTRKPVVSDLYSGAVGKRLFVLVVVPVPLEGEPKYLLNVAVLPERISELIARHLPDTWHAVIVDSRMKVVARSVDYERYMGKSASPDQIAHIKKPKGVWKGRRLDDTQVLAAHVPLSSGWTVVVALPEASVAVAAQSTSLAMLAAVMAAAGMSLVAAHRFSGRLQVEVRGLVAPDRQRLPDGFAIAELDAVANDLETLERRRLEAHRLEAHLAAIVASSNDAIFTIDSAGRILTWNRCSELMFQYSQEEAIGMDVRMLAPLDLHGEVDSAISSAVALKPVRMDTVRRRKDGGTLEVSVNSAPITTVSGELMAISVVVFEITERKRTERQRELLLRELDHRLKNVFGVISSMIGLQARRATTVAAFADGLRRRIYGLSALHDMVRGTGIDDAVSLARVVRLAGAASSQLSSSGPDLRLSAAAAIGLGLVLNELVTNALKYGALSVPDGTVTVDWTAADDKLRLTWAEHGGPPVTQPATQGFGTLLIQQSLAHLDGETTLEWQPDGLRFTLTCPLQMLGATANRTEQT